MSTKQRDNEERIDDFIKKLAKLDPADCARLRRNAGRTLEESRAVLGLFYRTAPHGLSHRDQQRYFLVATLFPLGTPGTAGDLGNTLAHARTRHNAAGLDRRIETLLDADAEQLPFRLRQAISFAQSNRQPVDWRQLLGDVLRWDDPCRSTQRRWAQSFFGNLS